MSEEKREELEFKLGKEKENTKKILIIAISIVIMFVVFFSTILLL